MHWGARIRCRRVVGDSARTNPTSAWSAHILRDGDALASTDARIVSDARPPHECIASDFRKSRGNTEQPRPRRLWWQTMTGWDEMLAASREIERILRCVAALLTYTPFWSTLGSRGKRAARANCDRQSSSTPGSGGGARPRCARACASAVRLCLQSFPGRWCSPRLVPSRGRRGVASTSRLTAPDLDSQRDDDTATPDEGNGEPGNDRGGRIGRRGAPLAMCDRARASPPWQDCATPACLPADLWRSASAAGMTTGGAAEADTSVISLSILNRHSLPISIHRTSSFQHTRFPVVRSSARQRCALRSESRLCSTGRPPSCRPPHTQHRQDTS
jgi:hypothetical protein